jgi:hypothetical protein
MKRLLNIRNSIFLLLILAGSSLVQSCVVYNPYDRQDIPLSDIVKMSKDGVSSRDIIKDMRQSHSVYALRADQIAKLHDQGVQDSVLNYMQNTHYKSLRDNQMMQDSYFGWYGGYYGPYGGFCYGWPYGLYGWGWGPTIIFSGHHGYSGFHGGGHGMRR